MRLTIYMKSGNRIEISGVKDFSVKSQGDEVVSLAITYKKLRLPSHKLLMTTIALGQIEAITRS